MNNSTCVLRSSACCTNITPPRARTRARGPHAPSHQPSALISAASPHRGHIQHHCYTALQPIQHQCFVRSSPCCATSPPPSRVCAHHTCAFTSAECPHPSCMAALALRPPPLRLDTSCVPSPLMYSSTCVLRSSPCCFSQGNSIPFCTKMSW
jgi:hypothetical protein